MKRWITVAALVVTAVVAAFILPAAPAKWITKYAAVDIPNIFGMTLEQLLWFLVSEAVLGGLIVLVLSQFNLNPIALKIVKGILLAAASALVTQLTPLIPPQILGENVGRLILMLLGAIFGWLGFKVFGIALAALLKSAAIGPEWEDALGFSTLRLRQCFKARYVRVVRALGLADEDALLFKAAKMED